MVQELQHFDLHGARISSHPSQNQLLQLSRGGWIADSEGADERIESTEIGQVAKGAVATLIELHGLQCPGRGTAREQRLGLGGEEGHVGWQGKRMAEVGIRVLKVIQVQEQVAHANWECGGGYHVNKKYAEGGREGKGESTIEEMRVPRTLILPRIRGSLGSASRILIRPQEAVLDRDVRCGSRHKLRRIRIEAKDRSVIETQHEHFGSSACVRDALERTEGRLGPIHLCFQHELRFH